MVTFKFIDAASIITRNSFEVATEALITIKVAKKKVAI